MEYKSGMRPASPTHPIPPTPLPPPHLPLVLKGQLHPLPCLLLLPAQAELHAAGQLLRQCARACKQRRPGARQSHGAVARSAILAATVSL